MLKPWHWLLGVQQTYWTGILVICLLGMVVCAELRWWFLPYCIVFRMLLGYISPLGIFTRIYVLWLLCFCIHWGRWLYGHQNVWFLSRWSASVIENYKLSTWSSHVLSCFPLLLIIASTIALAGMAENSIPLGSGRSPTGDAAGPPSLLTSGSVRSICRCYYLTAKKFCVFNFHCCWIAMKIF